VTAPDIDDWDQPVAAYTGPERRHLDHSKRAYVCHHDGGYAVTDGEHTVHEPSLEAARNHAFTHNYLGGFHVSAADVRDEVSA
jgi:hypothetical protein